MNVDKFFPDVLLERFNKYKKKVDDEFVKRYLANDVCIETDLQSPTLFEEVDQILIRLSKIVLFKDNSKDFLSNLIIDSNK